ncbi:MAG: cytochrome b/b6 domain-containing protein [Pseudomonadota bacterium]|jgi:cytochrome b
MGEARAAIAVWDLPTRLFHWGLVALIGFCWWSAETHHLAWHKWAGEGVAALLVFRLWWGLFGGSTARFSQFLKGPKAALAYAGSLFKSKSDKAEPIGHNALGGWSVAALILAAVAVVGFGLFAEDTDGEQSGPLEPLVNFDQASFAAHLHETAFHVLQALVLLHLAAIAFYALVKKDQLVGPMLTGKKALPAGTQAMTPGKLWALAIGLILAAAGFAALALQKGLSF